MAIFARLRTLAASAPILLALVAVPSHTVLAQETLGSIVGRVRVVRGDVPPERILVTLELHGIPMDSVYIDSSGTFGFHGLHPETYWVSVNDEHYQPVRMAVAIRPTSLGPSVVIDVQLTPKDSKNSPASDSRQQGSNPNMMDIREYSKNFPKKAVKEFEKGVASDRDNNKDEAIAHYRKAIELAPDFYPAHNNLGSDELSQSHFDVARSEFEKVVRLNHSDASAYFNLANVSMLMNQLPEAQSFLDEGLRRQPDSAMGKFLLGTLNIRIGKLPEAELALRQAINLDPSMAQPRLQLVNLFLKQGRNADAVAQLHAFLTAIPSSPFSSQAKQILQRLEARGAQAGTSPPSPPNPK
jgi:tetratricopeptide (TPR) repeat protein